MNTTVESSIAARIGSNIRAERVRVSMTQETLAEHLGVSAITVSKWERGETSPRVNHLAQIASLFRRPIGDFFHTCELDSAAA